MLIKSRDNNDESVSLLKRLLTLPSLTQEHDFLINRELKNIQKGIKGEKDSAHYLDFDFGDTSKNWVIIHDLRIEINGRTAQIDHLIINRCLEFFVLETKNFYNGIEINEKGEFSAFYSDRSYGIASPIAQNERHISVLADLFKEAGILPKRIGLQMKPKYFNYILMSPNSIIKRPQQKQFNTDCIIKVDALKKIIVDDEIKKIMPNLNDFVAVAKMVSSETIMTLANEIIAFHKPHNTDYIKKFGIKKSEVQPKVHSTKTIIQTQPSLYNPAKDYYCYKCKKSISVEEANYCWQPNNIIRFDNKAYCRNCQKQFR